MAMAANMALMPPMDLRITKTEYAKKDAGRWTPGALPIKAEDSVGRDIRR